MLNRWRNMGRNTQIITLALILWAFGEGLWAFTLQPIYLDYLGASAETIGLILALAGLGRLVVMIPAGLLADRFGAWKMLLPGWVLGVIGTGLLAIAPSLWFAAIGFILYGTSALVIPVINLYIVQSITADKTVKHHAQPQEILTFVHALIWGGAIISPALGGFIADTFSLRAVFGTSVVIFCTSMLIMLQTKAYPVEAHTAANWRTMRQTYLAILKNRQLQAIYGIFALAFMLTIVGTTFAPKYLEDVHALSRSEIGFLGSVLGLGAVFWNIQLGKQGVWRGLTSGLILSVIAFSLIWLTGNWIILLAAYFLLGSWDIIRPVATSIVAQHSQPAQQGGAFAMVDTLHGLSTFLAPASAGILYGMAVYLPFALSIILLFVTLSAILWFNYHTRQITTSDSVLAGNRK